MLKRIEPCSVHSCISDFPYDLKFMGRKWDNTGDFYSWCKERADGLYPIMKHGGYIAIFGHPKTNHRMKCAFEDAGFKIVEEIDWVYLTGMPKSQDIGKLFDKEAGAKREVVGENKYASRRPNPMSGTTLMMNETGWDCTKDLTITAPATEIAKYWDGWKTAGLKPAHEPITIFQKPLDGSYIQNIKNYGCGGMNISACRVPYANPDDLNAVKAKCNFSENSKSIGFGSADTIYGTGNTPLADARNCVKEEGRFPANIILDEHVASLLDEQTGVSKSPSGAGDIGGGSRMFTVIKYCQKVAPKERTLPNGERNPHVTLKPVELIKWLIKLLTPKDGLTIDITAGSCTHAVACEELNKSEGYSLQWVDVEITNTEREPYCEVGKMRVVNS